MQAHSRRAIVEHMTVGLQELVCEQVFAGFEHGIDGVTSCARGPKVHVALAPPGGTWMMSKDTPPRLLVHALRLLDLYGEGGELSPGGACRENQTFTQIK